jgi:transposase-like protein
MAYRKNELGELVRSVETGKQARARSQILAAYRAADGNATQVARLLGVHHATLLRWVARLALAEHVDAVRAAPRRPIMRKRTWPTEIAN